MPVHVPVAAVASPARNTPARESEWWNSAPEQGCARWLRWLLGTRPWRRIIARSLWHSCARPGNLCCLGMLPKLQM